MQAVLTICHRVVITDDLNRERERHASRFFRKWLTSMFAHKKQDEVPAGPDPELRARVVRTTKSQKKKEALEKDAHLVEAALASDCAIVSLDDEARKAHAQAARKVKKIGDVMWVNPDTSAAEALKWLRQGAKPTPEFQLGPSNE